MSPIALAASLPPLARIRRFQLTPTGLNPLFAPQLFLQFHRPNQSFKGREKALRIWGLKPKKGDPPEGQSCITGTVLFMDGGMAQI